MTHPGEQLGPYTVEREVGRGGMGVVYLARDPRLDRSVAIKVLPDQVARDPERLARFEREARLLASLNHSNIAGIFGIEEAGGIRFLALEYVDGPTLGERLDRGALSAEEAIHVGVQIAAALEAAHENGVVHRDLKPANVKLTPDGVVKVLDFGLAKGTTASSPSSEDLANSPTIAHVTNAGMILGTAGYMSPEQAAGRVVDRRADIWSFGVVLFEMLTGRRLFDGESATEVLAAVMREEIDWSRLPADTPPRLVALLHRCLERNPKTRLRDIGEARIALEGMERGETEAVAAGSGPATRRIRPWQLAIVAVAAGVLGVLAGRMLAPEAPAPEVRRYTLDLPPNVTSSARLGVISPDGRSVAYAIGDTIWNQSLDAFEPRRVGVAPAMTWLFWSPDAKQIGATSGSKLLRFPAIGGEAVLISETGIPFSGSSGAAWGDDGIIVMAHGTDGLSAVPASGGQPHVLLEPDLSKEYDFHTPAVLPDGRGVLYTTHNSTTNGWDVEVFADGERRKIVTADGYYCSTPFYSWSGHVLYRRGGDNRGVWAVPFSLDRLEATGEPFIVETDATLPSVSRDGTLVFSPPGRRGYHQLLWFRPGEKPEPTGSPIHTDGYLALSPDARTLLYSGGLNGPGTQSEMFRMDLASLATSRVTFAERNDDVLPDWSPDGRRMLWTDWAPTSPTPETTFHLLVRASDGTGRTDTLGTGFGGHWSPDGRYVTCSSYEAARDWPIYVYDLQSGERRLFLRSGKWNAGPVVSPKGDLLAYASYEAGQWQIFLKPFPAGEGLWQVTKAGGALPQWDPSGEKLYFLEGSDLMEVEIRKEGSLSFDAPRRLLARPAQRADAAALPPQFEVARDGRFLLADDAEPGGASTGPAVLLNWFEELKGKR